MNIRAKRILCLASSLGLVLSLLTLPRASAAPVKAAAKGAARGGKGGALADTAMNQFKAKQYGLAAESFRKAIATDRANSTLYYYYALSLHYNNNVPGAMAIYNQIMQYFPGTDAAARAQMAMGSFGQAPARRSSAPSGSQSTMSSMPSGEENPFAPSTDALPNEAKLYFRNEGPHLIVEARFNNRPIEAIFDTGAEGIVIGKNQLRQLGLSLPQGRPIGKSQGVGDGGPQDNWVMPMNVSVGSMERKNVAVMVQEDLPTMPLLGQTFYRGMAYSIDNSAKCISFVKQGARRGSIYDDPSKAADAVPYTREGNEMVVNVSVNGRQIPMYFDTGAASVMLTAEHARSIGLTVPEDAPGYRGGGVAGNSYGKIVTVDSVKMGPIEKRNFEVHVDAVSSVPHPLLGQSFFGDCRYQIDEQHHVIHIRR
ncbi:MAG: retroviral-like aspartic protease family protein [Cyanobacteria bacterium SZAS LIN-2]|nr:retroviral-like aspartic protease family protein [Cyanobacteria bacterium SZAS LIN-2]